MPSQSLHSRYQIPYKWHDLQGLWHLVPIHVTSHPLCLWIHVNYIKHQTQGSKKIQPLYVKSKPPYLYLCDHTDCVDDITHTVFMTWHLLYYGTICTVYDISPMIYDITTLYPLHQSIIPHIKLIIFHSSSTVSLSSHPDYRSYNPLVCMITQVKYAWHHTNTYDITYTL